MDSLKLPAIGGSVQSTKEQNKSIALAALKRHVKKTTAPLKVGTLLSAIVGQNRRLADEAEAAAAAAGTDTTLKVRDEDDDDDDDEEEDDVDANTLPSLSVLRTFSPMIVHEKVVEEAASDSYTRQLPATRTHYAAVLFADISGFTRLANMLSVEQLQLHISRYFAKLFDCVERFGGDILKICGDAIMIMWPLKATESAASEDERRACAITACLCGRELIQTCGTYTAVDGEHRISLSLHCGVGIADVTCYWVGKAGRWEFLITGPVLAQIAETEPEAKSGEVVVSAQVHALTKDHLVVTPTPRGNFLLTHEIVEGAAVEKDRNYASQKDDPLFIPGLSDHPSLDFDRYRAVATAFLGPYLRTSRESLERLKEDEDEVAVDLQHYVHNSARSRLRHLGRDFKMGELREVVTLFINLMGLEEDFANKRLDVVQSVMAAIIASCKMFGGAIRQFVVDDKGCVAIVGLGVAHHTFTDDAVRAVEIARVLRTKIQNLGKNCAIGVSQGMAFCGLVGSTHRREYAMMASCINLAARLMCSCAPGQIIVDERVRAAAGHILAFDDKGTVVAKGYAEPVRVFEFIRTLLAPSSPLIAVCEATIAPSAAVKVVEEGRVQPAVRMHVVGRHVQMESLKLGLRNFYERVSGCTTQFHLLEGDEGSGKTELAKHVVTYAASKGMKVIGVLCLSSYTRSDYSLIAQLLEKAISLYDMEEKAAAAEAARLRRNVGTRASGRVAVEVAAPDSPKEASKVEVPVPSSQRFKTWAENHLNFSVNPRGVVQRAMVHGQPMSDILDLIATVFNESSSPNELLDSMSKKQKAHLLKTMLVRALKVIFNNRSRMLVLENLCNADVLSAAVISDFIGSAETAFGVITYRGQQAESREKENEVFSNIRGNCYIVSLPPLRMRHTAELAAGVFGVQRPFLTKEVISRIQRRTNGNPGLVHALAAALLAELEAGRLPNVDSVRTPGQMDIVQKVDALDPPLQLLLKTAASIGQVFSVHALQSVYDALALTNDLVGAAEDANHGGGVAAETLMATIRSSISGITKVAERSSIVGSSGGHNDADESAAIARDSMGFGTVALSLNVDRLVDLGLFATVDFVPAVSKPLKRGDGEEEEDDDTLGDTPEIGIHASQWVDARGLLRRGWAAIDNNDATNNKKINKDKRVQGPGPMEKASSSRRRSSAARMGSVSRIGRRSGTLGQLFIAKKAQKYLRFSHPSVQVTAYALSLEADRIPVHAATVSYLATRFARCPGVEETCLHHCENMHSHRETLHYLVKCAHAARETHRHAAFVQRATQLVTMLVRGGEGLRVDADLDHSLFDQLSLYRASNTSPPPSWYPYEHDDDGVDPPQWDEVSADNGQWLLRVGAVLCDMMVAMASVGDSWSVEMLSDHASSMLQGPSLTRGEVPAAATGAGRNDQSLLGHFKALLDAGRSPRANSVNSLPIADDMGPSAAPMFPALAGPAQAASDVPLTGARSAASVIESFSLPSLTAADVASSEDGDGWGAAFLRAAYVHSYVRGQEALAIVHIMRGNAAAALSAIDDALAVVHGTDGMKERVLLPICCPRLYALRSCCCPVESRSAANNSLIASELWLSKAKEPQVVAAVELFDTSALPALPGLRQWHTVDSGEWVLMVVVAMRLCGEGKWQGAVQEFDGAIAQLREINDKTLMMQVKVLYAWQQFLTGDVAGFHKVVRVIKQYVDNVESEPLTACACSELLALRFSLSCFFDAADILVSRMLPQAISSGPGDVGGNSAHGFLTSRMKYASMRGFTARASTSTRSSTRNSDAHIAVEQSTAAPSSLYSRIAEVWLKTRSTPGDVDSTAAAQLCHKACLRTPCHYIGGVYVFFLGQAVASLYEHLLVATCDGLVPSAAKDLQPFVAAVEAEAPHLAELHRAVLEVVAVLDGLSKKGRYPVLLYFARALSAHVHRMRGEHDAAMRSCVLEPHCAAESMTLAVAYLKQEMALCRLAGHNDRLSAAEKRENLSMSIMLAKEATAFFMMYEAEIEIAILKRCVADCEDHLRDLMPGHTGTKGTNMTARSYWLDLSNDDSDSDEG